MLCNIKRRHALSTWTAAVNPERAWVEWVHKLHAERLPIVFNIRLIGAR
jgi:hypothetical protein